MDFNYKEGRSRKNRFSQLGTWYILALSIIATTAIVGQILIQDHLNDQLSDSRVVNVAGRQRMLSQRISKCVLQISNTRSLNERRNALKELGSAVVLWKRSHIGLLHGDDSLNLPGSNSLVISTMFNDLEVHFNKIYLGATSIINLLKKDPLTDKQVFANAVRTILDHQSPFLEHMDAIVFQFDDEAQKKVTMLSRLEYILITLTIVIIILEILFIFRPTAKQVNRAVNQLISSEQNATQLTKEIGALYGSLEKSYEQLSQISQPIENPRLYAKTDQGGNVIFFSDLFMDITGMEEINKQMRLCDLFADSGLGDDWMDEIVETVSEGKSWHGEISFVAKEEKLWAEIVVMPVMQNDDQVEELLVLGSDITRQKNAESTMRRKNRAEVEKKINQQKFRSVLILEGQEEERKRIAMDIHDGIGQMLTSLKYQVESIDSKIDPVVDKKVTEIKHGITDVIKEVRKVTFNLKPTVLGDYGLQAALNVFVQEIGKLTDIELIYRTEGDMTYRLPQKVENNIFRIVQEAINNGIKYSQAKRIEVLLQQTENDFVITVNDEGTGFDEKIVEARDVNIESGRGFFNMYERTEYISGKLEIKSAPGKGTSVKLTVPIKSTTFV